MGRKHSTYPEDRGSQEQKLRDEVQDGIMNLTGRWNDKTRNAKDDGCNKSCDGDDGLDFGDRMQCEGELRKVTKK